MWEAYKRMSELVKINQSETNGLVYIHVDHPSPYISMKWVKDLTTAINDTMRRRDIEEATKSKSYLIEQLEKTSVADMRAVFYKLVEEQTQKIMLAEVRDEYIFETIDPPVIPEEKVKPKRALICILGTIVGGAISFFVVLFIYFYQKTKPY